MRRGARFAVGDDQLDPGGQPARAAVAPGPDGGDEKTDIAITQQGGSLIQLPAGARLADVVKALNSLGATPRTCWPSCRR